jgi:hypothetical protein
LDTDPVRCCSVPDPYVEFGERDAMGRGVADVVRRRGGATGQRREEARATSSGVKESCWCRW